MDILSLMKKMRLDTLLVERGLCESEEEALRVVLAHEVKVDDVEYTILRQSEVLAIVE